MSGRGRQPFELLMVEDNPADVRLAREALREARVQINFQAVEDGVEALAFLRREGVYQTCAEPDLILLDLNLPSKSGHEFLAEMRGDQRLRRIPVIVFSSSSAEEDVAGAYQLAANCYLTKPGSFDQFLETMRKIEDFWLVTAHLPLPRT